MFDVLFWVKIDIKYKYCIKELFCMFQSFILKENLKDKF